MSEEFKVVYRKCCREWLKGLVAAIIAYGCYNSLDIIIRKVILILDMPGFLVKIVLWGIIAMAGLVAMKAGRNLVCALWGEVWNLLKWSTLSLLGKQSASFESKAKQQYKELLLWEKEEAERRAVIQKEQEERQYFQDIIMEYYTDGKIDKDLCYAFGREDGYVNGKENGIKQVYFTAYDQGEADRRRDDAYRAEQARQDAERKKQNDMQRQNEQRRMNDQWQQTCRDHPERMFPKL